MVKNKTNKFKSEVHLLLGVLCFIFLWSCLLLIVCVLWFATVSLGLVLANAFVGPPGFGCFYFDASFFMFLLRGIVLDVFVAVYGFSFFRCCEVWQGLCNHMCFVVLSLFTLIP